MTEGKWGLIDSDTREIIDNKNNKKHNKNKNKINENGKK